MYEWAVYLQYMEQQSSAAVRCVVALVLLLKTACPAAGATVTAAVTSLTAGIPRGPSCQLGCAASRSPLRTAVPQEGNPQNTPPHSARPHSPRASKAQACLPQVLNDVHADLGNGEAAAWKEMAQSIATR